MRPLELTVEGFRSYRGRVTFDWRDRRLVGIVGPIGAGKSSILDAVAFALYAKTPGIGSATKSLIHQLCDEAHVALTFEVGDEVWKVVRAPKRKGQSGHQLMRLASDDAGAEPIETVVQEGQVNERVEVLLGMDFHTFCRSVLLAQNRFADFLKATRTERDKVLKGVFGYERLDAARGAADRRVDRELAALEGLQRERGAIDEARARLDEARTRAEAAAKDLQAFDAAAPEVERLTEARREAEADEAAEAARVDDAMRLAATMPPREEVEEVVRDATKAAGALELARTTLADADAARAAADADLASVRERLGDRTMLRTFEQQVERHDRLAEAAEQAEEACANAGSRLAEAVAALQDAVAVVSETTGALAEAGERVVAAEAATADAREALTVAQHAEMAHELRGQLTAGERCPVCAQPVTTVPRRGAAPKAVAAATKALRRAEAAEQQARSDREALAAEEAMARAAVAGAEQRKDDATRAVEQAAASVRDAEATLTSVKDLLAEQLGAGEPRALIEAREEELAAAEQAARAAGSEFEAARTALDAERERADHATATLVELGSRVAGIWGALGIPRPTGTDPGAIRSAYVDAGSELQARRAAASEARADAARRANESAESLAAVLTAIGLAPGDDFAAARSERHGLHEMITGRIAELEAQITREGELERDVLETEARLSIAKRLAGDLRPARFLAFLLEEERAELAELGSGLFETLSDGAYRFAADDSFDILDLNAADRTRKADSLSGGETFLASLALALALAEMVARGGGRLEAFFLDEGFGSLDPEHLDRAMAGIERLVAGDGGRLVVLVSHVAEMREAIEDLIVLDKHDLTGDTVVVSGATLED
jgi:exonuclease SbcC